MEFLLSAVSSRMPSGGREVRLGRIFGSIEDSKLCFLASSTVRAVIYQTASKTKAQCELDYLRSFFFLLLHLQRVLIGNIGKEKYCHVLYRKVILF